jgi:DNA-binding transcriptional regulator GbsR (MarR family)
MAALTPAARRFVLHWGEMGTRWGINRTVAQIHALLYVSPRPLPAEEIAETLDVARSNVSTSLKELQGWGIVKIVHRMGDRRDHFVSLTDVWEMLRIILAERKRREIDPTLQVLRECMEEAGRGGAAEAHARERVGALLEFFETMDGWYRQVSGMPVAAAKRFVKLGGALGKAFGRGR